MTTDPFTTAARALGADPAEVRESMRNATEHAERNGMPDEEFVLWIWHAGAVWARGMEAARAAQEPTDADALTERIAVAMDPDARDFAVDVPEVWEDTMALAARVLPIVAEEVRKATAGALREAAGDIVWSAETLPHMTPQDAARGLVRRADRIETGDSDEHR